MVKARNTDTDAEVLASITVTGKSGDTIFQEGDEGDVMFVIEEGEIELRKTYAGDVRRLAVLGVGDFFGEMSLLEGEPREASAVATKDYKILSVDYSTFDELVQANPEIAIRMLGKLSHRLMEILRAEARALEIARGAIAPAEPAKKGAELDEPRETVKPHLFHESTQARFELKPSGVTTIGRFDHAKNFAPDVDFTSLNTDTVSRQHARITKTQDGYFLQEEMARNGTFVNGRKLKKGRKVKLKDGDVVAFGTLATTFHS